MRRLIIATLFGATAIGGVAYAAQTTTTLGRGSEAITRAQYIDHAERRFERLDANSDGVLTSTERKEARRGHHHGMMGRHGMMTSQEGKPGRFGAGAGLGDANGDGRISRAEFAGQSAKIFGRLDTNGNGVLESEELNRGPRAGRMAKRLDQDRDGKVTRAEFDSQTADRFARMDKNGDGQIDATERPQRGAGRRGAAPQPAPAS